MRRSWPILLVAFLSMALYLNSLAGEFITDDKTIIVENRAIRNLSHSPSLFLQPYWPEGRGREFYYRPLVMVSYALNYALGGLNPFGYHLVNLGLHTGVCILVYFLCLRIFSHTGLALAAALLFTVHPIHTEAVSWIAGRNEPLAALFLLGAWLLYLRSRVLLSALVFFCALLSKENALVFPGIIVLSDLFFLQDKSWWERWEIIKQKFRGPYLLYIGIVSLYLVMRYLVLGRLRPPAVNFLVNPTAALPFVPRFLTALKVLGMYLWRLVAPIQLSADYSYNQISASASFLESAVLLTTAALIGLTLSAAWTVKRQPQISFGLGFFFITFAPVSNFLIPTGTLMGERFMYLPSLGFCIFMVGLGQEVRALCASTNSARTVTHGISNTFPVPLSLSEGDPMSQNFGEKVLKYALLTTLSILITLYSTRLVIRNQEWKNEWTLFQSALRVSPGSALVRYNVGITLARKGKLQEAEQSYQEALRIMPGYASAHDGLGIVYTYTGHLKEAEKEFRLALQVEPFSANSPKYYTHLAILYLQQNRLQEAKKELRAALDLDPEYLQARYNLGILYLMQGLPAEGEKELQTVLQIEPNFTLARKTLADLYRQQTQ